MTRRSPARLLAPVALVAVAIALIMVVGSGGGDGGKDTGTSSTPATTTTQKKRAPTVKETGKPKTYTVKPGDTPSGIAQRLNISVGELLDANPRVDPNNLKLGSKLRIP